MYVASCTDLVHELVPSPVVSGGDVVNQCLHSLRMTVAGGGDDLACCVDLVFTCADVFDLVCQVGAMIVMYVMCVGLLCCALLYSRPPERALFCH